MISSSFRGRASSSRTKSCSGSVFVPQTFMPFGRYAEVGSQKIKDSQVGARLHGKYFFSLGRSGGLIIRKLVQQARCI